MNPDFLLTGLGICPLRHSLILILMLVLILSACSWSHKPVQPMEREAADRALKAASGQLGVNPAAAIETYRLAMAKYRAMADIEGEMWCLSGIAKASLSVGDSLSYLDAVNGMAFIVSAVEPDLDYIPLLLELQLATASGDLLKVSQLYRDKDCWPVTARLRIMAYAIQADTYLGKEGERKVRQCQKLLRSQKRKLHRRGADHALQIGRARYALAYHYLAQKDFKRAEKNLKLAMEPDRLYSDFDALGYDYWLAAKLELARNRPDEAIANLHKALRLFEGSSNAVMLGSVRQELKSLEKGE